MSSSWDLDSFIGIYLVQHLFLRKNQKRKKFKDILFLKYYLAKKCKKTVFIISLLSRPRRIQLAKNLLLGTRTRLDSEVFGSSPSLNSSSRNFCTLLCAPPPNREDKPRARTHARMHTHTHTPVALLSLFCYSCFSESEKERRRRRRA